MSKRKDTRRKELRFKYETDLDKAKVRLYNLLLDKERTVQDLTLRETEIAYNLVKEKAVQDRIKYGR